MTTHRRLLSRVSVAAAFLAFVPLSACGGSKSTSDASNSPSTTRASAGTPTTASSSGKSVDPCKLITADEAAAALGEAVDPGKEASTTVPACVFGATHGAHITDDVQLQVQQTYVFDGTWSSRNQADVASAFTIDAVPGIGDQAFFQIPKGGSSVVPILLGFKKGTTAIYVSVNNRDLSQDQVEAAEKQLATKAVARL